MCQRIVSYPRVVNFLLNKYASNDTTIYTKDAIKNLQKRPKQRAYDFADYTFSRTNHYGSAYVPIIKIKIFTGGITH